MNKLTIGIKMDSKNVYYSGRGSSPYRYMEESLNLAILIVDNK